MEETFVSRARRHASAWKSRTATLPEAARGPAPYWYRGEPRGMYPFCLPVGYANHNLLPDARPALNEFKDKHIVWHAQTVLGPTNHLLSSQVQCVNALEPLSHDADGLRAFFDGVLDIADPLPVESGRFVAFEYVGSRDYLGESAGGRRSRGALCTSVDAAIRYRTSTGAIELTLIEWKYVEDYRGHQLSPDRRGIREARYRSLWDASDSPLRTDLVPYRDMFVEPFYQLMRQQLLAHELEKQRELEADVVRVVHVSPRSNTELRLSLNRDSHQAIGGDVFDVWRALLRRPDRFVTLDSSRLRGGSVEYQARYSHS